MVAALALLAALAAQPSQPAPATAPPATAPPPAGEPQPQRPGEPPAPEPPLPGDDDAWRGGFLDRSHAYVSRQLVESVAWFDGLFADDRNADFQRRGSAVRWQNELRFESGGLVRARTGFRLDLKIPELEGWFQRLRLIVYAQNLGNDALLVPEDPSNPAVSGDATQGQAAAELRYDVLRLLASYVDVGAGVRAELPPGVFLRARYRSTLPLGLGALARFTASGFYDSTLRLGSAGEATAERPFGRRFLLRWSNVASISESRYARGFEWGSEAAALWALTPYRGWGLSASAAGVTRARPAVNAYRLALRFRRDLWRRWLFVELEPDLTWRRDEVTDARRRIPGITLRAEVHFDAAAAPAPVPDP